jgi:hypothetical protein
MKVLELSNGDHAIQAFPLVKGQISLTNGTYTNVNMIHCTQDGSFTITWDDNTTQIVPMTENRVHVFTKGVKNILLNINGTYNIV